LLHGEYRLLGLATMFATEMIRRYGLLEYRKDVYMFDSKPRTQILSLPAVSLNIDVMENSRRLSEMGIYWKSPGIFNPVLPESLRS